MGQPLHLQTKGVRDADRNRSLFEKFYLGWDRASLGLAPEPTGSPGPLGDEEKAYHLKGHAARRLADREGETPPYSA